ncbi:uncharacterized protein [Littorina saxatilis]|uniref:uncharacterized protein n=1 Tax=Littorina saxatilis TaxID=31220 RepID=UPI0038B62B7D
MREKRGTGRRKRVTGDGIMPVDWNSFLRVDQNKQELFSFLGQKVIELDTDKLVITTQGPIVLSNRPLDAQTKLSPCSHEEADTRLIVHLSDAANNHRRILIRTVDTDVVVLAIAAAARHPGLEVWIAVGVGQNYRYISAHDIASMLGPEKASCLPLFHSFSGCDTVSSFSSIGKKTAWDVWYLFPDISEAFQSLSEAPTEISAYDRALLERYVVLLYDRTSNFPDVNSARGHLFAKVGRQIDNIPPTSEALLQHARRAVYQGGHIWGQAEVATPSLPNPGDWGWQFVNGAWQPFWTALDEASKTCRELWKCGCKKGCKSMRCRCRKAVLKCTALCKCTCVPAC